MSGLLANLYAPAIDSLLERSSLVVPEGTRDNLVTVVVHARCREHPRTPGSRSPIPASEKALAHATKVRQYLNEPPSRKERLVKRAMSLRSALLESEILPLELLLHLNLPEDEYFAFVDALATGVPSIDVLDRLIDVLTEIAAPGPGWQSVGRPISQSTTIIRTACIAWTRAGRTDKFTWNETLDSLDGALPDFIRALLSLCNGTDEAIINIERRRPSLPNERKAGQGMVLNDKAIQAVLLTCKKDGLI